MVGPNGGLEHPGRGDVIGKLILMVCLALPLAGCGLSMSKQRKYTTYQPSEFWDDGASARPLPSGVASQRDLALGAEAKTPPAITPALIQRGKEQFTVFCSPCHGASGEGDGVIVQRGFPHPPSYDSDALLSAPADHFFDVITNGYGVMYSYASRIGPRDRWAIVAYIRALQLSRQPKRASQQNEKAR